ncbi:hypothetical protein [Prochlorococcus marinus]|uniref:hypothetical protein n=1 Tax=Prochlorococcus marinus TaxID=1219 RepID=UPI0007B3D54C|nr:hypothetical protein [Prochlorococcus marinus]
MPELVGCRPQLLKSVNFLVHLLPRQSRSKPISEDRALLHTGVLPTLAWSRQRNGKPWSQV